MGIVNSTPYVQKYRRKQIALGRKQRALYATDKEFKAVKKLLREMRCKS